MLKSNLTLRFDSTLKNYLEDDLKLFKNFFELPLTIPINVRKQVLFDSCYFTSIPVGWPAGWPAGRLEDFENKANSVQFKLKFPI